MLDSYVVAYCFVIFVYCMTFGIFFLSFKILRFVIRLDKRLVFNFDTNGDFDVDSFGDRLNR